MATLGGERGVGAAGMNLHERINFLRQERIARLLHIQLPIVICGVACVLAGVATVSIAPDAWQAGYVPLHIGPFLLLLAVVPSIAAALRICVLLLALCLTYMSLALLVGAAAGLSGCARAAGGVARDAARTPSGAQCGRAGVTLAVGIVAALLALNVGSLYIVLAFHVGRARAVLRAVWRAMGVAQLALCVWYCAQLGALLAETVGSPPAEVALFAALALVSLGLGGLSLWEPLPRVVHAFLAHRGSRVGAAAGVAELFHGLSADEVIAHARLTFRAIRLDKLRREHFAQRSPPADAVTRTRRTPSGIVQIPASASHGSSGDEADLRGGGSLPTQRSVRTMAPSVSPFSRRRVLPTAAPAAPAAGVQDQLPRSGSAESGADEAAWREELRGMRAAEHSAVASAAGSSAVGEDGQGSPCLAPVVMNSAISSTPAPTPSGAPRPRRQTYRERLPSMPLLSALLSAASLAPVEPADDEAAEHDAGLRRALFLLSEPAALGAVDVFISHSWRDDADAKWAALQSWRDAFVIAHKREPLCWYDKACIDPDHLQDQLGSLPVYLAGCKTLLALVGPTYWSRLWCVIEMFVHFEMGASIERVQMVQFGFADGERLSESEIDVTKASATDPADEERLRAVIEGSGEGLDGLNEWLRKLVRSYAHRDREISGRGECDSAGIRSRLSASAPAQVANFFATRRTNDASVSPHGRFGILSLSPGPSHARSSSPSNERASQGLSAVVER